jgi:glycosyltransferase involved in cell wall biosynthesis
VFGPIEKSMARSILNLPPDKKILLFGALGATSNERKGYSYLRNAIDVLSGVGDFDNEGLCMVVFGASHPSYTEDSPFEVRYLGRLYDASSLALSYSAADIFVAPSLEDNLPNTVVESLACGTPVVAFNIGGMPDMIEHQVNGYLSEPRDSDSLAVGIKWILEDDDRAASIAEAAREKALKEYALEIQAQRYRNLFASLGGN